MPECPTCGQPFDTRKGAGVHHVMVHPDEWPDRFWHYVDRDGADECWEWQAFCNEQGYGYFRHRGENRIAHRLAYQLASRSSPEWVLHHCDNPSCVNPAHLYDGDHADNTADMVARDRAARGEDNGDARLTEPQVVEIRERYAAGATQADLADEYGVTQPAVGLIVRCDTWEHAGPPDYEPPQRSKKQGLDRETAEEIREAYAEGGVTHADVAEEFGITGSMVGYICRGDVSYE